MEVHGYIVYSLVAVTIIVPMMYTEIETVVFGMIHDGERHV